MVDERRQGHGQHADRRGGHRAQTEDEQDEQHGRPKPATPWDVVSVDALGHGPLCAPLIDEATANLAVAARGRLPEIPSIARTSQTTQPPT